LHGAPTRLFTKAERREIRLLPGDDVGIETETGDKSDRSGAEAAVLVPDQCRSRHGSSRRSIAFRAYGQPSMDEA
jgi:hypothetical protein